MNDSNNDSQALELQDICVTSFNGHSLIEDISFCAKAGEITCIIGPNGSGKSTLLKALIGLFPKKQVSGDARYRANSLRDISVEKRAQLLSFLDQRQIFEPGMQVSSYVGLGLGTSKRPHIGSSERDADNLHEITAQLRHYGIAHLAKQPMRTLSGGEITLAALARLAIKKTPILLVDEPTSSLDPHHCVKIADIMYREKKRNRIIVWVLHDLTLARRYADKVVVLKEGRNLATATFDDIIANDILTNTFGVEFSHGGVGRNQWILPHAVPMVKGKENS